MGGGLEFRAEMGFLFLPSPSPRHRRENIGKFGVPVCRAGGEDPGWIAVGKFIAQRRRGAEGGGWVTHCVTTSLREISESGVPLRGREGFRRKGIRRWRSRRR